ncbi:hypothetical protein PTT_19029 [Pyrenophora teres f. teres 0-1]|uniref:Uncharacterized protein n=1 Tax=Pyrenophora teres f. teres (strain 0-1) TaxID=861557 RepID=E3S817_PYRTT|nr:hypothetical protein PTT_19029 [Pyrenophora teres f. teres 0-1]
MPLLGTEMSRNGTFSKSYASNFDKFGDNFDARSWESLEDTPTWMNLLWDIRNLQDYCIIYRLTIGYPNLQNALTILGNSYNFQMISIKLKTRSCDFMPPDIVRPVASTTLGDLIIMAHRMGMKWSDFRPSEGK